MRFLKPVWKERLASTNTALLERLRKGEELEHGFVLAVREQTAGRGRLGREWVSRKGRDLTFSFVVRFKGDVQKLVSLPMAVALGVAEGIRHFDVDARPKWPNDLLVGGRKICGILAEKTGDALGVGVGVNVGGTAAEMGEIDRPATSLLVETGRVFEVEDVLEGVLQGMEGWIGEWERGGFVGLREAWEERGCYVGERVEVEGVEGVLEGFGEWGQALVRDAKGGLQEVWSGDMEWRGVR